MAELKFLTINNPNDWMSSADWPANQTHELKLYMFSTAYWGCEMMVPLKFKLEEQSKVAKFKYHPEDQALGKPTTIYTLLGAAQEPEVDSDFEQEGGGGGANAAHDDEEEEEEEEGEEQD